MKSEIEILLEARYDFIYVNTFEDTRVMDNILKMGESSEMDVDVWSFSSGLRTILGNKYIKEEDGGMFGGDPVGVIKHLTELKKDTILILKDYHMFLKDVEVVSAIKDELQNVSNYYLPIIILSPILRIPTELEKNVTIVDFFVPSMDEIEEILELFVEAITDIEIPNRAKVIKACLGLTSIEIQNALSKSYIKSDRKKIDYEDILKEKEQIIRKNGILEYINSKNNISDVGGVDNLKEWLVKRGAAFTREAEDFGVPTPKGLILTGVPGCGKSLICKTISNLWGLPLLKLDTGTVMDSLVGSSEENMRKALNTASSIAPCILWIDEIEKALSGTGSSNFSDGGTTSRVFSNFLNFLQDREKPVFVIATANDMSQLPPELLRQGRFDGIFFLDLPNDIEREDIFKIHLQKRGRDPKKFNLKKLSIDSKGFSGAEIEQSIIDALFNTFHEYNGKRDINNLFIIEAISRTIPLSRTKKKQIDLIREGASEIAIPASIPENKYH